MKSIKSQLSFSHAIKTTLALSVAAVVLSSQVMADTSADTMYHKIPYLDHMHVTRMYRLCQICLENNDLVRKNIGDENNIFVTDSKVPRGLKLTN